MVMSTAQARQKIAEMVPNTIHVFYNHDTRGWVEKLDDSLSAVSKISIKRMNNVKDIWIDVPKLIDETLYGEWLDRSIRCHVLSENISIKVYKVKEHMEPGYNSIYKTDEEIVYIHPNNDKCEIWGKTQSGKVQCCVYDITRNMSYSYDEKGLLSDHILIPEDLYQHPGNEGIHHLDCLLKTPSTAYAGERIYYCPESPLQILVYMEETWLWVSKEAFLKRHPKSFEAELAVFENLYCVENQS